MNPYDRDYYETGKTSNYHGGYKDEPLKWKPIAERLSLEFPPPRRVLEVGCAKGFLVKQLRAVGFDAYGIDVSEYAIGNCDPEVRDFVSVGSVEALPFGNASFDLICSFDVLEHIEDERIGAVMRELFRVGFDQFHQIAVPSGLPDNDVTHVNVKEMDYWDLKFPRVVYYPSP